MVHKASRLLQLLSLHWRHCIAVHHVRMQQYAVAMLERCCHLQGVRGARNLAHQCDVLAEEVLQSAGRRRRTGALAMSRRKCWWPIRSE